MMDYEVAYEENKYLMQNLVNKYSGKYRKLEREDINQMAMIGLWDACENYQDYGVAKFSTYAHIVVERKIKNWCRDQLHLRRKNAVNSSKNVYEMKAEDGLTEEQFNDFYGLNYEQSIILGLNTAQSLEHEEIQVGVYQQEFEAIEMDGVLDSLGLCEKQAAILKLRYLGFTLREIAEKTGMHLSSVNRTVKGIAKKINKTTPDLAGLLS